MGTAFRALLFASMAALATSGSGREDRAFRPAEPIRAATEEPGGTLSVMTYNVKGLPWPVAQGREEALERIASRLIALRRQHRQPHIILLQEAFTADAMALATRAGYRHSALGPDAATRSAAAASAADLAYLRRARWDRGEQLGKSLGSGLMILSDYPITRADRFAFPDFACAGFDCLANKGVVIAHIDAPGGPIGVVNTHLNARTAAGVTIARSQQAYARQTELMARFVTRKVRPHERLILGGDMNIGRDPQRRQAFFAAFSGTRPSFVAPDMGGARQAIGRTASGEDRHDLARAVRHGKDWLFARDATGAAMQVVGAQVPFGKEAEGKPLSDHFGYVIQYAAAARKPHEGIHFASQSATPMGAERQ